MRLRFFVLSIFILLKAIGEMSAQDTLFYQDSRGYSLSALKSGYDINFKIKHREYPDSVSTYQYGAYMKTKIHDIVLYKNYYIILYENTDCMSYSIFEYSESIWCPLMGSLLVCFTSTRYKVDVSIVDGDKFKIIEDGRETLYQINFTKKTLERYDK
jgi:hypothetical protein